LEELEESHESVPSEEQRVTPTPPPPPQASMQMGGLPPAPPNFLFLRNMINNSPGSGPFYSPPPPHFCAPPVHGPAIPPNKRVKDKVLWGKILKHQHFHASSRAQHSAPRGGPPRAWSNQDLTEALHNVWNKKMTTSQVCSSICFLLIGLHFRSNKQRYDP